MFLSLKPIIATAAVAGGLIVSTVPAVLADDMTTTTTTTEHREDGPGAVITASARAAGAIVDSVIGGHSGGCTHKSVTKTDEDTGESVTKSRTDCN